MHEQTEQLKAEELRRWPLNEVESIAIELRDWLAPFCTRIEIAGSIRRRRPTVGDIELVYVPLYEAQPRGPGDLFKDERTRTNVAEVCIRDMESCGVFRRRKNSKGQETYGPLNKLLCHVPSGIPVDLFATTEECWYNYLVCRTGGKENNLAICQAATAKGWSWTPYGPGFSRSVAGDFAGEHTKQHIVHSESEVFDFVGLPYLAPNDRH